MNKLMMMGCVALLATCVVAAETKTAETKPMDLKSVAAQPAVQELLMEEDGVAILEKPDGSKVYFARGTAAYEFSDAHILYTYNCNDSKEAFESYLDMVFAEEDGLFRDDVEVTADDKILTLSTCTDTDPNARWLVQGVKVQ